MPVVGSTIPHEVNLTGPSEVIIGPHRREPAWWPVGGAAHPRLAGVKDALAKSLGSRNAINTAWATPSASVRSSAWRVSRPGNLRRDGALMLTQSAVEDPAAEAEPSDGAPAEDGRRLLKTLLARSPMLKIRLKKAIRYEKSQGKTAVALGLRRLNSEVVQEDNPVIRGMIRKISHLLEVEVIEDAGGADSARES